MENHMNYSIVLNAYLEDLSDQFDLLQGFLNDNFGCKRASHIFIICPKVLEPDIRSIIEDKASSEDTALLLFDEFSPKESISYICENDPKGIVLFHEDDMLREICVRCGARSHSDSLLSVLSATKSGNEIIARRKIYTSHIQADYRMITTPFFMEVNREYSPNNIPVPSSSRITTVELYEPMNILETISTEDFSFSTLEDADFVVACGLGIKNRENADMVKELSLSIGAEYAATRAGIMSALFPLDKMLGVSGAVIRPDLIILLGISGASAFYAGIENSKHIIAINTDRDAPIMKKADLAVIGDACEIFRLLAGRIQKELTTGKNI